MTLSARFHMKFRQSGIFKITTPLPETFARTQSLPSPITARFHPKSLGYVPTTALAAKLKVEYLTDPHDGHTSAAWDLFHIVSATRLSHVDEDGWCVFHFEGFQGQKVVLHLDAPGEEFAFRFVVEVWGMREPKGLDVEGSVREKGKIDLLGRGFGEVTKVCSLKQEQMSRGGDLDMEGVIGDN